ncbi:hypothetical protein F4823DRAFT_227891 [Ustulina deusta]|nr:hypothetical protein F4823DRAFT_227891 [Ustulina deusta]
MGPDSFFCFLPILFWGGAHCKTTCSRTSTCTYVPDLKLVSSLEPDIFLNLTLNPTRPPSTLHGKIVIGACTFACFLLSFASS